MNLYESVEPGNICIEWQTINDTGKALIDTWFLGILGIASNHGNSVHLRDQLNTGYTMDGFRKAA